MKIVSVNVSREKGTVKEPAREVRVNELGIEGDAHAGPWHRQVSLLGEESILAFAEKAGRAIRPGEFAENLTVRGLGKGTAGLLDRFRAGEVELEVTQIGKVCHGDSCAIFRETGACVMPKEGLFCRVIRGGVLRAGQEIEHLPRSLEVRVFTSSDRAFRGEYEDRSGPRVQALLEEFFRGRPWRLSVRREVLPDEEPVLREAIEAALGEGADVVLVTGGTGVGPRDVAPEVVAGLCDKLVPGIMEAVRLKYGVRNPRALLSRSVAGVAGGSLLYALPGSPRAVEEYMAEILQTMEHLLLMARGVGH